MLRRAIGFVSASTFLLCGALWLLGIPQAKADYYNYPCNYPFVGTSADVDILAHGGGQYCDGPTEINGTHYHCMSGGGGISGGAIGLAPIAGLPITGGGFGGSGIGMSLGDCHYVCPDLFRPPNGFPNPPAAWVKPLVVEAKNNVCIDHMAPAGFDGAPVPPADIGPPKTAVPEEGSPLSPGSPVPLP